MDLSNEQIEDYLAFCKGQKRLDEKTLKAYRIDLRQFQSFLEQEGASLCKNSLSLYITELNERFKASTAKRKIASLKAFCSYMEQENKMAENPFYRFPISIREPILLPKTIPLHTIEAILKAAYDNLSRGTEQQQNRTVRDIAVLELLFATGIRVSELCKFNRSDIDLIDGTLKIHGKGAKERMLQIGNPDVLAVLVQYDRCANRVDRSAFFTNRAGQRLSEQSVRRMLCRYEKQLGIGHITPHMFRHSFATLLIEEDVNIRYVQQMLGHSSITTTQIYTHVATGKQRQILSQKHPRNKLHI